MKNSTSVIRSWLWAWLVIAGMCFTSNRATVWADEQDRDVSERLARLEQQVHQLAERQEQCYQRLGPMLQNQPSPPPCQPMVGPQRGVPDDPRPLCYAPPCRRGFRCLLGTIALVLMVVHILLASWVFTDIRKRGEGSGLFIVLALLIGVPGTVLYLLARIGDRRPA